MRKNLNAFTLAEVLITLGIIGVVAAITMPMLITNINERANSERQANIAYKITQAMEQMRAHGKLVQYESTDAFVDELQKYLKITKRCDAEHIADCWPTSTIMGNDEKTYTISNTTTRDKLHLKNNDGNNDNVGLVLADGASLILTYNTTTSGFDVGDRIEATKANLPVGGGKTKEFPYTSSVTNSIDFVMDVNGTKGPNKETTSDKAGDIRSFKAARFGEDCPSFVPANGTKIKGMCVVNLGIIRGISEYPYYNWNNRWAGAKKACEDINMVLPTINQLKNIYTNKDKLGSTTKYYWTIAKYRNDSAYALDFESGDEVISPMDETNRNPSRHGTLCVAN